MTHLSSMRLWLPGLRCQDSDIDTTGKIKTQVDLPLAPSGINNLPTPNSHCSFSINTFKMTAHIPHILTSQVPKAWRPLSKRSVWFTIAGRKSETPLCAAKKHEGDFTVKEKKILWNIWIFCWLQLFLEAVSKGKMNAAVFSKTAEVKFQFPSRRHKRTT